MKHSANDLTLEGALLRAAGSASLEKRDSDKLRHFACHLIGAISCTDIELANSLARKIGLPIAEDETGA